jgi:hypothetical protein
MTGLIKTMLDDDQLKDRVRDIMVDLLVVCYRHNINQVNVGAVMRIMGVDHDTASAHDSDYIEIDENFPQLLIDLNKAVPTVPTGTTLH